MAMLTVSSNLHSCTRRELGTVWYLLEYWQILQEDNIPSGALVWKCNTSHEHDSTASIKLWNLIVQVDGVQY